MRSQCLFLSYSFDKSKINNILADKLISSIWKIVALNPKILPLTPDNTKPIEIPKNELEDFTLENLMKYYKYNKDSYSYGINFSKFFMNGFSNLFTLFYGVPLFTDQAWNTSTINPELEKYDLDPIVDLLGCRQSDKLNNLLVNTFIRDNLVRNSTDNVIGSQETHKAFCDWLSDSLRIQDGTRIVENYINKFPITEFTKIMKANNFEMTRRSRGMVYLNTTFSEAYRVKEKEFRNPVEEMPSGNKIINDEVSGFNPLDSDSYAYYF
jgi:hypothetical protein